MFDLLIGETMNAATQQIPLFIPCAISPRSAFDVHAVSIPAGTFTGDFWFTHRVDDRLWFALGDVAGKGLPAALVMAMIQEQLEQRITSCARAGCDPATTIQRLHTFLRPLLPRNRFATAVLGWLRDDGAMRLVNAGHCPPIILRFGRQIADRHTGPSIQEIPSTGPIVGALPSGWCSVALTLGVGDKLLLYSDGVTESTSAGGQQLGSEGLERALAAVSRPASSHTVATTVLGAVRRHAVTTREDDLTLLVIGRGSARVACD
jgi:sigma-B regulation protein RsbU (phosphoserine phosphatase)